LSVTSTTRPNIVMAVRKAAEARSDSSVGRLLLLFFLALYLLTGGGHGYSPDGEFGYNVGRSLSLDPEREYMHRMRNGFSQWGVMVPVLSQPLIVLGEVVARVAPQMDHATVDGRSYKLGIFREPGLPEEAPTVGPEWDVGRTTYVRTDVADQPATSMAIISFLSHARQIPQDTVVANVTVIDIDGGSVTIPIRAGVETAEWSSGRGGEAEIRHSIPRVASIWSGNTLGRNYYAEIPLGGVVEPREIRFEYQTDEGRLFVRSLVLLNGEIGAAQVVPSDYGFWSERENRDFFARLVFTPYNAIVSAVACVLLFALVRLFGYSQVVALVATLLYGLATIAWPYSKYDFSEPTLVMLLLATLYLVYRWGQDRRERWLVLAGLAALASAATKYVAAILIPVIALQILLLHWERYPSSRELLKATRPLLAFASPFLIIAAPAILFLGQRFGYYPSIFEAWAGIQRGWLPLPLLIGLHGLLLSPGKSFFLYSPPMLLAIASLVPFVRRHSIHAVAPLSIALIYFTIYSKKVAWHAGAGWGPRYQLVVIPLLILVIVPLIQKAIEERHRWARYALLATFLLGVGIQLLAVPKSFDSYLGIFRSDIVHQLPDEGAPYGGADYYPHAAGLDGGNSITATLWAWPFSPILAHAWLLSVDALALGRAPLEPLKDQLLGMPPWRLWGIDAAPANPEHGLGFDFWSMKLWTDFPSHHGLLAGVFLLLLLLEAVVMFSGARLVGMIARASPRQGILVRGWLAASASAFLAFNVIHFLL
jgi:hypothetical protein